MTTPAPHGGSFRSPFFGDAARSATRSGSSRSKKNKPNKSRLAWRGPAGLVHIF
jgi:hypothetical protein